MVSVPVGVGAGVGVGVGVGVGEVGVGVGDVGVGVGETGVGVGETGVGVGEIGVGVGLPPLSVCTRPERGTGVNVDGDVLGACETSTVAIFVAATEPVGQGSSGMCGDVDAGHFVGVVGGADERTAGDVGESEAAGQPAQVVEFRGGQIALDR